MMGPTVANFPVPLKASLCRMRTNIARAFFSTEANWRRPKLPMNKPS